MWPAMCVAAALCWQTPGAAGDGPAGEQAAPAGRVVDDWIASAGRAAEPVGLEPSRGESQRGLTTGGSHERQIVGAPSAAAGESGVIRRPAGRSASRGSPEAVGGESTSVMGGLRMLLPLAVVLAAIWLAARLARRVFPQAGPTGGDGVIRVLSRQALSPRQSLCLVRLGNRVVLLGVTGERINTLVDISDAEEASALIAAAARGRADSFTSALAAMRRVYRGPQPADEGEAPALVEAVAGASETADRPAVAMRVPATAGAATGSAATLLAGVVGRLRSAAAR
jgi:flagellar biosynthetic protein FliO